MSAHTVYVLLNYLSVFVMLVCMVCIATQSESRMQKLALLVNVSLTMCCLGFLFRSEAVDADAFIVGKRSSMPLLPASGRPRWTRAWRYSTTTAAALRRR